MTDVWLKNYPSGVSSCIDENGVTSLGAMLEYSVERYRHLPAFNHLGVTIDYHNLDLLSDGVSAYLQHVCGVDKSDRVAIMMPNVLQYPVILFAAFKVGAVVVNVNPLYTSSEVQFYLKDAGVKVLFVLENFVHTVQPILKQTSVSHVVVTGVGDLMGIKGVCINGLIKYVKRMVPRYDCSGVVMFKKVLKQWSGKSYDKIDLSGDDLAFLQYTGGTTGVAKAAMLTHRNMIANVLQVHAWVGGVLKEGVESVVTALPLYHIFSLMANCLLFVYIGGCNILVTNPRDIPGFVKLLRSVKFTGITGVNTLFNALLQHSDLKKVDFSSLKVSLGGGMAVQEAVAEQWKEVSGCPLLEAYGLTEASPAVCINPFDLADYNGSIGLPIPSTQVCVRDSEGVSLGLGDEGELCVKGPQVMKGYWNNREETALIFTKDGWLRTGDMAKISEKGYVYLVGRKKDMILVSGFNVYPQEIEDVVVRCPGVLEAAAIGVPSVHSGESIKLFVVLKVEVSEAVILDFCKQHLAAYKIPKEICFVDALPKSMVGKVLHRKLRDL